MKPASRHVDSNALGGKGAAAIGEDKLFRNIIDNIPGAVLRFSQTADGSNEALFLSDGAEELWGVPKEAALQDMGKLWARVFLDDVHGCRTSIELSARRLTIWNHEWRIVPVQGGLKWLQGIGRPERRADGSITWDALILDITERKLREEHLAIALTSSRQGIVEWWTDSDTLVLSPSWVELTGYGADDMQTYSDLLNCGFIHPADTSRVAQDIESIRSGDADELEFECRVMPKAGGIIWITARGVVRERGPDGQALRVTCTIIDVTKLKRTQDQLEIVLGTARQGLWQWEPIHDRLVPLTNWLDMTGYEPGELTSMQDCYERGVVYLDDQDRVIKYLEALRSGAHGEAEIEFRIKKKNGEIFWALTRASIIEQDAGGQAAYIIGTNIDISERKLAEEQLRVAAIAFESHGPMMISDPDGRALQINAAFTELLQYTPKAFVGQELEILRSSRHSREFFAEMNRRLQELGRWEGEVWKRRQDGVEIPLWETITTVVNDTGHVTHCVSNMLDISERLSAEREVERLAFYDSLTELPNRRYLISRLEESIASARRRGVSGAVVFLDLDNFKKINDSMGHSAGDEVLIQVAGRLQTLTRQEDVVSRLGGDEFVVLIADAGGDVAKCTNFVSRVADRIASELRRPFVIEGRDLHITGTLGISIFPQDGTVTSDFLRFADTAMYKGKAEGRNTTRFYHPELITHANERLEMEQDLRLALSSGQFDLHYQPQIHSDSGLVGAEALLRWKHPEHGNVPPDRFIPVAEECGLIIEIGQWVIEHAFATLKSWIEGGDMEYLDHLSINVSSHQFRAANFVEHLRTQCAEIGVPAERIILELTERTVIEDIVETADKMEQLREVGFRFSLDDFGIGYSSLSYLRRLPLDQLKIDRSFVADVTLDANADAIAQTIIAMGTHLGFDTVAEGVETEVQREFLQAGGCTTFQGYLFCKPLARASFEEFCRKSHAEFN
jgi:diguanylate cyclase (GGDEF)-like protein/PAS domain S-box-containing protein